MRTLLPIQLQTAECNLGPNNGGSGFSQNTPEGSKNTERTEFAESECDVDTLKKLKLGMRSTLWSRPASTTANVSQQQQQQLQSHLLRTPPPKPQGPQHQQPQQSAQRQQLSPAPQKLPSDYSISV